MAVQHIFISISKSALIRNLTLFSILAVDNHQLVQIIKSLGTPVVGKHFSVSGETPFLHFHIVEQHVPFPPHLTGTQCILGILHFDFNFRCNPIILHFIILP